MTTKKKHFKIQSPIGSLPCLIVEFNNLEDAYKFGVDLIANGYEYDLSDNYKKVVYVKNEEMREILKKKSKKK